MSMFELRAVYGDKKKSIVINAAIRAELPGGNEFLDMMSKVFQSYYNAEGDNKMILAGVIKQMKIVKQAMVSEILRRYEIEEFRDETDT